MKLAVLSTYYENIGDDLIRMGINSVLSDLNIDFKTIALSKSNELSQYCDLGRITHSPRWQKGRTGRRIHDAILRRIPKFLKVRYFKKRVLDSDALLVAGTPLFYFTHRRFTFLNKGNWAEQIIGQFLETGKPIYVVGAGFILDDEPLKIAQRCPEEILFLKKLIDGSTYFSVRDSISHSFLKAVLPESTVDLTHCPSLWNHPEVKKNKSNRILISYSEESSRVDDSAKESVIKRRKVFGAIVQFLSKKGYTINLISHNQIDFSTQLKIYKEFKLSSPLMPSAREMASVFGSADLVITWRVHGAMAARLANTPVLLFKTDNRYKMAEDVGAFILDDREIETAVIVDKLQYFLSPEAQLSIAKVPDMSIEKNRLKDKILASLKQ